MKTVLVTLLILLIPPFGRGQTDSQHATIIFYASDSSDRSAPIVYSKDQELGEVSKGHFIRLIVPPGVHYFALANNAPAAQQLPISISGGQEVYIRVRSDGFFNGNATEARAIMKSLTRVDSASEPAVGPRNPNPIFEPATVGVATTSSTNLTQQGAPSVDVGHSSSNATIFFYRVNDPHDSSQATTIYGLFVSGSRRLATLEKGEYFAINVKPGPRAFSWTVAPARSQQVFINVSAGQNVFNQVRFGSILPTTEANATAVTESLRPVDMSRVSDESVLVPAPLFPVALGSGIRNTPREKSPNVLKDQAQKAATGQSTDVGKYIQMLLTTEQDQTEKVLDSLLSTSATVVNLENLLDDSVEGRDERMAKLQEDFDKNSSMEVLVREIVNHLQARNEFMRAYRSYLAQVDLMLALARLRRNSFLTRMKPNAGKLLVHQPVRSQSSIVKRIVLRRNSQHVKPGSPQRRNKPQKHGRRLCVTKSGLPKCGIKTELSVGPCCSHITEGC